MFIKSILLHGVLLEHKYDLGIEIHPNTAMARNVVLTSLAVSETPTDEGRTLGTSSHDDKVIVLKNKLLTHFK
jgi:hypothetical protein